MFIKPISEQEKEKFNAVINHPLQAYEWGDFREKTDVKVIRRGLFKNDLLVDGFQLTIHPIPHTSWTIGYLPKGNIPTKETLAELEEIGKEEKCIFIQTEPNVIKETKILRDKDIEEKSKSLNILLSQYPNIYPSAHPLFTKYTFILDITKSEDELLKNMHPKARYNIRVAQRHNVEIIEDNSDKAFEEYLYLTEETTKRQGFFAHSQKYHRLQWQTLRHQISVLSHQSSAKNGKPTTDELSSHLLLAKYQEKVLAAWILFVFKDTLYYPYGASSNEHREVMASNLIMWEAIKFGKKLGLKKFDMWGALGADPDPKDPWMGFHDFKRKYGSTHVEFVGSYDLIINPVLYQVYKYIDKLRWLYLKLKK